jgi:hypothetical protein
MSIVLYRAPAARGLDPDVLSILTLGKNQCSVASEFVSCRVVEGNSRRSSIRALVFSSPYSPYSPEGEAREYGCNVSLLLQPSGRVEVVSWTIAVVNPRKYMDDDVDDDDDACCLVGRRYP